MAVQEAQNKVVVEEKEEEEVKWVNHYSSTHQILLVGEGDFSFSSCLALAFGSASNICASSLDSHVGEVDFSFSLCLALAFGCASTICASSFDSHDTVIKNYKNGKSNLDTLEKMGASVLHGVDATRMKVHPALRMRKFDWIVFNFPHAGFLGKEDNSLVIVKHRKLVLGFFENASRMLRANGEVHVSHKTTGPFHYWNLQELANKNSLSLIDIVDFKLEDYPGYNNKRGGGWRCDEPFPLGECSTFKFRFSPAARKKYNAVNVQGVNIQFPKQETSFESRHFGICINEFPGHVGLPSAMDFPRESSRMFKGHLNDVLETSERVTNGVNYTIDEHLRLESFGHPQRNFTRNMNYLPGCMGLPLTTHFQSKRLRMVNCSFNNDRETYGREGDHVSYSVHGSYFPCLERHIEEAPRRTLVGDLYGRDEQHLNALRQMVRDHGDHFLGRGMYHNWPVYDY